MVKLHLFLVKIVGQVKAISTSSAITNDCLYWIYCLAFMLTSKRKDEAYLLKH